MTYYGPIPPHDVPDTSSISTPVHTRGYAKKVRRDLKRMARLYNGMLMRVFSVNESGTKCTDCVDAFTGQIVISDCPVCDGTGFITGYTSLGDHYAVAQLSPKTKTSTEIGDAEGSRRRDTFILVDVPLLEDQDLLVSIDTRRIYKIVDVEPQIVRVGGEVVMQIAECAPISKGAPEYRVVTW